MTEKPTAPPPETSSLSTMNPVVSMVRQVAGLKPLNVPLKRKYLALLLAGAVDIAQATVLAPYTSVPGAISPVEWGVDIATSIALVAILGWNWRILLAFFVELVPMVSLFPTWSALILTITAMSSDEAKPSQTQPVPIEVPELQKAPEFTQMPPPNFTPETPASKVSGTPQKFPGSYHQRSR